jgi:hypothetical protein
MDHSKSDTKKVNKITTQEFQYPKKLSEEEMKELGNKIIKQFAKAFKSVACK